MSTITFIQPDQSDQVFGIPPTAKGRHSGDLSKVAGVLRETEDEAGLVVAVGRPVVDERDGQDPNLPFLWRMKFLERTDGKPFKYGDTYWLFVTAQSSSGGPAVAKHRVVITKPPTPRPAAQIHFVTVHVDPSIQPGPITATAFDAQGSSAQNHYIVGAWMNNVPANYIYDVPDATSGFWWATFPTLASGTYTLLVVDSANHSASVSGLVVT
ncbi:MAG: hypothetical protein U0871_01370 [Gemmataceae bacterium]